MGVTKISDLSGNPTTKTLRLEAKGFQGLGFSKVPWLAVQAQGLSVVGLRASELHAYDRVF